MIEPLEQRIRTRLRALGDEQLLRRFQPRRGIDLASNDYLGLAAHPLLKRRMMEAIDVEGCGSTGSRLVSGDRECFATVERRFAALKGTARSLYFSSGYLANLAVLTSFPETGDLVLSDERNHASLIDGIRLSRARRAVFPHVDVAALSGLLESERSRHSGGQIFIVTESLFSMDGDIAPLKKYASLCRSFNALLIVDEAHAVGVYGERGSGLIDAHDIARDVLVSINTAGKALGVSGAFVAGADWAVEYLVQRARTFMFSTAPPPAIAAALDASLSLVDAEPQRRAVLADRARLLRARLVEAGIDVPAGSSPIVPVVLGDNARALETAASLQSQGFDVRAIRPPSVAPGSARLRLTANVNLSEPDIDRFATALAAALGQSAPCPVVSS